jgi:predicted Rossmann-fold nucleotide-binding protein
MKKIHFAALPLLVAVTSCDQPKTATPTNELFTEQALEYLETVPYDVNRTSLYNAEDLYAGYDPAKPETFETCYDTKVYKHYIEKGKQAQDVEESLARTLHDHGIHVALDEFFRQHDPRLCVGIMGGHALLRTDPMYKKVVLLSKRLTEQGFIMLSGGGPGAMEATHLGAWMAGRTEEEANAAIEMLTVAPSFKDEGWLASSFEVMKKYPLQGDYVSLGIPTYLYGHEPSAPFATHIAKFFENSIREDLILTVAFGGIIYTPGSAGTMQEIFQDAVQNHYLSFGYSSPMIFLGTDFWTKEMPVYPFLQELVEKGKYKNLQLSLTDDFDEIEGELKKFRDTKQD